MKRAMKQNTTALVVDEIPSMYHRNAFTLLFSIFLAPQVVDDGDEHDDRGDSRQDHEKQEDGFRQSEALAIEHCLLTLYLNPIVRNEIVLCLRVGA